MREVRAILFGFDGFIKEMKVDFNQDSVLRIVSKPISEPVKDKISSMNVTLNQRYFKLLNEGHVHGSLTRIYEEIS